MKYEIRSRWNYDKVLLAIEAESIKAAVEKAVSDGARLDGASLVGASLDGASLDGASLIGARLDGASLAGASLVGASLVCARLDGASLIGARLDGASLDGASLVGASLIGARLDGASLIGASLVGAKGLPEVPVIADLDAQILARIETGGNLDMADWHSCETTHCRGGWAIVVAGETGKKLEKQFGTAVAAALLYNAARPGQPIPDFYASEDDAMEDIKRNAAASPLICKP